MDNKQKKKLLNITYATAFTFAFAVVGLSAYFNIANIITEDANIYVDYLTLVISFVTLICFVVDCYKTIKNKNKYAVAKLLYVICSISFILCAVLFVLNNKNIVNTNGKCVSIILLIIGEALTFIGFIAGLKLSKFQSSTTITIDSSVDPPNYDDELMLKKRLDELNRKLEMKKVQERINKIQQELDE